MLIVPWEALGGPRWRNTKRIPSATGKAAYRIPDGLTRTHLYEVKNVTGKLSLTSQLKDLEIYSQQTNRQFVQIHKKGLKFSKPLQKLIDDRIIITLELP